MDIRVVRRFTPSGEAVYYLRHDYDLDIFADLPGDGPFSSSEVATDAARRLIDALSCVDD